MVRDAVRRDAERVAEMVRLFAPAAWPEDGLMAQALGRRRHHASMRRTGWQRNRDAGLETIVACELRRLPPLRDLARALAGADSLLRAACFLRCWLGRIAIDVLAGCRAARGLGRARSWRFFLFWNCNHLPSSEAV
jgi:hypothetical protein